MCVSIYTHDFRLSLVGGRESKTVNKEVEGIFKEVDLEDYWWDVLGKYSLNSYKGWSTTIGEGTKDTHLTSKSREVELKGA